MKVLKILSLMLLALTLAACGDDDDDGGKGNGGSASKNVNMNAAPYTSLEFPRVSKGNCTVVTHSTNAYGTTYSFEWDHALRAQRWTCFYFTKDNSVKNWARGNWPNGDPFQKDPMIPANEQPNVQGEFSSSSYPDKGFSYFQRGHICASEDRVCSKDANEQTFYMTNMFPQGGNFNSGIWSKMEAFVRDKWGRKITGNDTLFVVKGGTIDHESQILCRTKSGFIVPRYFFMALLLKRNNSYQAMGFWVEHLSTDHSNDKLSNYLVSIRELEEKTCSRAGANDGIDFFCNLPDDIEQAVETQDVATLKRLWNVD